MAMPSNETEVMEIVTECLYAGTRGSVREQGEDDFVMAMAKLEEVIAHIDGWIMMDGEKQALIDLCDAAHETLCTLQELNA